MLISPINKLESTPALYFFCLNVISTVPNVISITDGQIFLMTDLFNAGQRPAIDSGLSVSRVGSAAQLKAMKQVAGSLKIELASFRELQAFSQFGSDLDAETKRVLKHGNVLMEILKQAQYDTYPVERQIIELFAAKHRFLDELKVEEIKPALEKLYSHISSSHKELIKEIVSKKVISDSLESSLKEVMTKFFETLK